MCEYAPHCTKRDDPLAGMLWRAKGRASLLVLCPPKRHPIAALYELPDRGMVVCCPGYRMLNRSIFAAPEDPNGQAHMHAGLIPLRDYADDETENGRCRCGTWAFRPRQVSTRTFGHNDRGQPFTLASYVETADLGAARRARDDEPGA